MPTRILFLPLLLLSFLFLVSCNTGNDNEIPAGVVNNPNSARGNSDLSSLPTIKFEEEVHDFGKIIEGETVSYAFKFRNTGKSDLVIADVTTSCGCTVPSYPKTPVRPGDEEEIRIAFSSAGRRGYQTKTIVVVANTQPNTTLIKIKALVVSPGGQN